MLFLLFLINPLIASELPVPETSENQPFSLAVYTMSDCGPCKDLLNQLKKIELGVQIQEMKITDSNLIQKIPSVALFYRDTPMIYEDTIIPNKIQSFVEKAIHFDSVDSPCKNKCIFVSEEMLKEIWPVKKFFTEYQWYMGQYKHMIISNDGEKIVQEDKDYFGFLFEYGIEWVQELSQAGIEKSLAFGVPFLLLQSVGEKLITGKEFLNKEELKGPVFKFWVHTENLYKFDLLKKINPKVDLNMVFVQKETQAVIFEYWDKELTIKKVQQFIQAVSSGQIKPQNYDEKKQIKPHPQQYFNQNEDTIIYLYANWCEMCNQIKDIIQRVGIYVLQNQFEFLAWNIEDGKEGLDLQNVPTLGYIKRGSNKMIPYIGNFNEEEMQQFVDQHLNINDRNRSYENDQKAKEEFIRNNQEQFDEVKEFNDKYQDLFDKEKIMQMTDKELYIKLQELGIKDEDLEGVQGSIREKLLKIANEVNSHRFDEL